LLLSTLTRLAAIGCIYLEGGPPGPQPLAGFACSTAIAEAGASARLRRAAFQGPSQKALKRLGLFVSDVLKARSLRARRTDILDLFFEQQPEPLQDARFQLIYKISQV
jgi:hypothetical protein